MEDLSEKNGEQSEGEEEGEGYIPDYVCLPKEIEEEEICESKTSSCSLAKTTSGNILHRMIKHPNNRRPPCLAKWPSYTSRSNMEFHQNVHQFRAAQQPNLLKQMCSLRVTSEPNSFKQPAIVATIGPSSSSVDNILELMEAGMNVARVNMAHVNFCSVTEPFKNIIEASIRFKTIKDFDIPVAVMMDLKGPEIRTGKIDSNRFPNGESNEIVIKEGAFLRLTSDQVFEKRCNEKVIFVNYAELANQINQGSLIYISDGQIKLRVDLIERNSILCVVEIGGILRNNQKVHIPMLPELLPAISNYDVECLKVAVQMDVDVVVVPKTRNIEVIKEVKRILGNRGGDGAGDESEENTICVFAKISSYEGLENIDCIIKVSDGIVIHRNDLSLELSSEKAFIAQKEIIAKCNRVGKPVLFTAELSSSKSMNKTSRRAQVTDIGTAIVDGADGIILVKETATGNDGPEVILQLSDVLKEAEAATMQKPFLNDLARELVPSIEPNCAVALAAVQVAEKIQASAILAVTTSGKTAQLLSWFRPRMPVIAITRIGRVARQMILWRAVLPLHYTAPSLPDWFHDVKARFDYGISYGRNQGIIDSGDLLVLVSGYSKGAGFTNCIRIVFASLEPAGMTDNLSSYYGEESRESSQQ